MPTVPKGVVPYEHLGDALARFLRDLVNRLYEDKAGSLVIDGYVYRLLRTPGGYEPPLPAIRRFGLAEEDLDLLSDMEGAVLEISAEDLADGRPARVYAVIDRVALERWWSKISRRFAEREEW